MSKKSKPLNEDIKTFDEHIKAFENLLPYNVSGYEVLEIRKTLRKQQAIIKRFRSGQEYRNAVEKLEERNKALREELFKSRTYIDELKERVIIKEKLYDALSEKFVKLHEKFEANFKFHEYIKSTLDRTADLMEDYDAVRE